MAAAARAVFSWSRGSVEFAIQMVKSERARLRQPHSSLDLLVAAAALAGCQSCSRLQGETLVGLG